MSEFIKAAEFVIWQIESAIDAVHWHRQVDQPSLEKMNTLSGSVTPVFQFVDEFRGLNQDDNTHRNVSFVWKDAVSGDVCDCLISLWGSQVSDRFQPVDYGSDLLSFGPAQIRYVPKLLFCTA